MQYRIIFWIYSVLWLTASGLSAQDILKTRTGETIACTILEVGEDFVSYTLPADDSKSRYILSVAEITSVEFADGTKQVFHAPSEPKKEMPVGYIPPDKVVLTNGEILEGEIVERKRFGLNFLSKGEGKTQRYVPFAQIARIEPGDGPVEYVQEKAPKAENKKSEKDFSYLPPHHAALSIGALIPMGQFGEQGGPNPGYAGPGFLTQAEVTGYIFRGTGVSGIGGYGFMPYKNPAIRNTLDNYLLGNTKYPGATIQNVTSDPWQMAWGQVGMGYISDWGRVMIDSRFAIGVMNVSFPTQTVALTHNGTDKTVRFFREDAQGLMISGSLALRVFLTRRWQVRAGFSISSADVRFSQLLEQENNGNAVGTFITGIGPTNLVIGYVGFELGTAITLGK
jgi:hypothetical protein